MLCREFETRMQMLLDQRVAPERDPMLLGHARGCAACRGQLTACTQLLDALDVLEVPDLPSDFARRVVAAVEQSITPAAQTSQSVRVKWLLAAAIAATLVLAVAIPAARRVVSPGRKVALPAPDIGSLEPSDSVAVSGQPMAPPSAVDESWLTDPSVVLEIYPEETRQRHRQQVHQIADDLRPIALPFNAALTAIRRSIPVGKNESKGEPRASINRSLTMRTIS